MYFFFSVENSNVSFTTSNRWTGDGINCRIRNNTSFLAIVYLCDIKKIINRMIDQMNSLKFMHYPTELFCAVWLVRAQGVVDEKIRSIFNNTTMCMKGMNLDNVFNDCTWPSFVFEYDRIRINNFCSHLPTPPPLEIHSFSRMLVIFGIISYTQVIVHTLNVLHHRLNFHFIFICANWSTTKWRAINNMKIVLLVLFGTYAYKNDRPPYYNLYLGRSHDVKWVAYTTFDPKGSFRHCFIMFLFTLLRISCHLKWMSKYAGEKEVLHLQIVCLL